MRVATPSDRVQVKTRGELMHPGTCALCGNGTCDDGYVDLDIYYDWEGQVYLCMNCAKQVAETIGCLLPKESAHLVELNKEVASRLKDSQEELENVKSQLTVFHDALRSLGLSIPGAADPSASVDAGEGAEPEPSDPPVTVSVADGRKPVAKKSTSGRRPNDASKSASSHTDFTI